MLITGWEAELPQQTNVIDLSHRTPAQRDLPTSADCSRDSADGGASTSRDFYCIENLDSSVDKWHV